MVVVPAAAFVEGKLGLCWVGLGSIPDVRFVLVGPGLVLVPPWTVLSARISNLGIVCMKKQRFLVVLA